MNAATGIIHLSISQRTPKIGSKTSKATEGTNPDNTLIWTAMLQNWDNHPVWGTLLDCNPRKPIQFVII